MKAKGDESLRQVRNRCHRFKTVTRYAFQIFAEGLHVNLEVFLNESADTVGIPFQWTEDRAQQFHISNVLFNVSLLTVVV